MFCPAESREISLKLCHFRTVDELAMGEHPTDRLIDGFAEPSTLRGEVDERYGFWTQVLVHGALQGLRAGHWHATSRRRGAAPCGRRRLRQTLRKARDNGSQFQGWPRLPRRSPQAPRQNARHLEMRSIPRAT